MQKRSNPLAIATPNEVDDSVDTIEKLTLKNEIISPAIKEEPKVAVKEEIKAKPKKIQKRSNPLSLDEKPAKKKPTLPKLDHVEGKYKKKIIVTTVNKTLFMTAQTLCGKKTGEVIEKALLSYLYHEQPKAYEALLESLKKNGCEIK